jgi:Fe-S oxidoreductase
VIHFINKPMPGGLPKKTARALLDIEDDNVVPVIRNPQVAEDAEAVFYFPAAARSACSARSAWPPRPCCGMSAPRPCCRRATCAAATRRRRQATPTRAKITTDNRVLFHRLANTLNYLDIKTVVVSCGTCMDQLPNTVREDLPGLPHLDIHEYLMEKGLKLEGIGGQKYMYHDPATPR